jgi:pimeloyl-ACP methyl ester carboxylesterase
MRVAHELLGLLPNARLVIAPNSGHMPFWEAPERFFQSVQLFLNAP